MANVVTRRFLNRNLFKLQEFNRIFKLNRCTSVFIINYSQKNTTESNHKKLFLEPSRIKQIEILSYSTASDDKGNKCTEEEKHEKPEKLSLFQRFKQMYKDYWYVLVPVHLVTSAAWFGGFYYLAKSGVDIVAILNSLHVSESLTNPLKDSSMGYIAFAYALYKIATPARYTVTLGGTTISINYLKKWGYIKPIPSKERLKEMYQEKKDDLLEAMKETREGFKTKSEQLKDKKDDIMDDFDRSIKQIKELGNKIKSKDDVVAELKKKVTNKSTKE